MNEITQAANAQDVASVKTTNDRLAAGLAGRDSVVINKKKSKKKKKATDVSKQIDDLSWADYDQDSDVTINAPIVGESHESVATKFLESIGAVAQDGFSLRNLKDRVVTYWEQTSYWVKLYEDGGVTVIDVLSEVNKGEYIIREEIWEFNGTEQEMTTVYSSYDDSYIGDVEFAEFLIKNGVSKIQRKSKDFTVATIGYIEESKRWAGWSHRALTSFSIGDMLFEEKVYDTMPDTTPFTKGGTTVIKTLDQAKQAAINFSDYVA
jgi:hypothetical protein